MTYIVDRIEETVAVLQDERQGLHTLPLSTLPASLCAGDVLCFDGSIYRIDEAATRARRERIRRLQDRLRRR